MNTRPNKIEDLLKAAIEIGRAKSNKPHALWASLREEALLILDGNESNFYKDQQQIKEAERIIKYVADGSVDFYHVKQMIDKYREQFQ